MGEGILSTIGNTPLIRLTKILPGIHFKLFAKLELFNPAGSMKDRPAMSIIRKGVETGQINPETVIIESSSGNMGIGIAQACAYYGLRFICVVDAKTTSQNIKILQAYGAEVDVVTEPDPVTGEYLHARLERVQALLQFYEDSFWPNQYANLYNPLAHRQTMGEIISALGSVDYVFCAVSTCGTIRGCAEYIREHGLATKVFAVDAIGSVIWGGGPVGKRLLPGHGAAIRPQLFQPGLAEECIYVTDLESVVNCRRLVQHEAILAGGSSGAIISGVERVKDSIPHDATCVAILPDRGERYLDTIYSDAWVKAHLGDVSYLYEEAAEVHPCLTLTY